MDPFATGKAIHFNPDLPPRPLGRTTRYARHVYLSIIYTSSLTLSFSKTILGRPPMYPLTDCPHPAMTSRPPPTTFALQTNSTHAQILSETAPTIRPSFRVNTLDSTPSKPRLITAPVSSRWRLSHQGSRQTRRPSLAKMNTSTLTMTIWQTTTSLLTFTVTLRGSGHSRLRQNPLPRPNRLLNNPNLYLWARPSDLSLVAH